MTRSTTIHIPQDDRTRVVTLHIYEAERKRWVAALDKVTYGILDAANVFALIQESLSMGSLTEVRIYDQTLQVDGARPSRCQTALWPKRSTAFLHQLFGQR